MTRDNTTFVLPELPRTAAEMRSAPDDGKPSYRPLSVSEVRSETTADGEIVITGLAAVFDSPSVDMYGWYEVIIRGAFRKVLAANPDVRLLVNHGGLPYARTTNGTLTLREVVAGLEFRAVLPDTQSARELHVLIQRGDVTQMSFAFRVGRDSWIEEPDGRERREIEEFSALREISAVTFAAYEDTIVVPARDAPDDTTSRSDDDQEQPVPVAAGDSVDDPEERNDDPAGAPDDGAATRWRARQRLNALVINTTNREARHA